MITYSAIVYDIEIIKGICGKGETKISGIEYCDGWHDHANMGISVIGAIDCRSGRPRVFCKDNFAEFAALVGECEVAVSFNGVGFDNKVLAHEGIIVPPEKNYDILREAWVAAGLSPEFQYPSHIGYGLDAFSMRNFQTNKTGHGELAPVKWQRGEIGSVIDYCLNDNLLTKALFDKILMVGELDSPRQNKALKMRAPFLPVSAA